MNASLLLAAAFSLGQWADDAVQDRGRRLWEQTGLERVEGLRFYDLPGVSQRHVIINGHPGGIFKTSYGGDTNVNRMHPWLTPSGLQYSPVEHWTKLTAAVIPAKVKVFRDGVRVSSGQELSRLSWSFPDGTSFAEVLIRRDGENEWPFEVRVRSKDDGKWDDGTVYRPWHDPDDLPAGSVKNQWSIPAGKLADFGIPRFDPVPVWELPPAKSKYPRWGTFTRSRLVATATHDAAWVPKDFMGTQAVCMKCHSRAGEATDYGSTGIRGSDTILSWHPFTPDTVNTDDHPKLDLRWAEFSGRQQFYEEGASEGFAPSRRGRFRR